MAKGDKKYNKHLLRVDKSNRRKANKQHEPYQSPYETRAKGWFSQKFVNHVLGRFGDR